MEAEEEGKIMAFSFNSADKRSDELRNCPFCGSKAHLIVLDHYREFYVTCGRQNCVEQKHCYKSMKSAIEAWNRRV